MKSGFTIAEVLVTLGLIGVTAAITLPGLVSKYHEKQTVVKIKYSLNILNNAFRNAVADHGDIKNWDYVNNLDNIESRKAFIDKYLIPYIKGAAPSKSSGYNFIGLGYSAQYPPRQPDGTILGMTSSVFYPITTVNGITFYPALSDLNGNLRIEVDLNGLKPPNIYGRDIFVYTLEISKNSIYPVGYQYLNPILVCTAGNAWACAAAIIKNDYKIPKNYPVRF